MDEATQQMVEFLLINLLLSTIGDDATRADIIQVVQPLRRIKAEIININVLESINRLPFQTYIIIIGRSNNRHFRLSVTQTLQFSFA